jgi:hypothetical protein
MIFFEVNENDVDKVSRDSLGELYACLHEMPDSVAMQPTIYTKNAFSSFL